MAAKYDHINFVPPKSVRNNAKRALEVRATKPKSQRGMTSVGLARARDLSNGKELSPQTVRRMANYFTRHESDKKGSTWKDKGKGWQAWMGWGGDSGKSWANKIVRQMESADRKVTKSILDDVELLEKNIFGSSGGKMRLAKPILKLLSPVKHDTYTEVFAGSASVFFRKEEVEREALNDMNAEIANVYFTVPNLTDTELDALDQMDWKSNRKTFNGLWATDPHTLGRVKRLHRFLYCARFSFGKMPAAGYDPASEGMVTPRSKKVRKYRERLQGVRVFEGDYLEPLQKMDCPTALHFLDPPYVGYNSRIGESDFDEERFYKAVKAIKGEFLVTYGVRGEFPKMVKEDGSYRTKVIHSTRTYGRTGKMGAENKLGNLCVMSYGGKQKSMDEVGGYVVRDMSSEDWDLVYRINDPDTYLGLELYPNSEMRYVSKGFMARMSDEEIVSVLDHVPESVETAIEKIQESERLEMNEVMAVKNFLANMPAYPSDREDLTIQECVYFMLGGSASRAWSDSAIAKSYDRELNPTPLIQVGASLVPSSPVTLMEDAVVSKGSQIVLGDIDLAKAVEDAIGSPFLVALDKDGSRCIGDHVPMYSLALVPSVKMGVEKVAETLAIRPDIWDGDSGTGYLVSSEDEKGIVLKGRSGEAQLIELVEDETGVRAQCLALSVPDRATSALAYMDEGMSRAFDGAEKGDRITYGSVEVDIDGEFAWAAGDCSDAVIELYFDGDIEGQYVVAKKALIGEQSITTNSGEVLSIAKAFGGNAAVASHLENRGVLLLSDEDSLAISSAPRSGDYYLSKVDYAGAKKLEKSSPKVASVEFVKTLADKRIVYGPVLVPEEIDLQDDIISAEEIEQAAHEYLSLINKETETGLQHNDMSRPIRVVESYLAPVSFSMGGQTIPKGTWMMGMKVLDDEVWRDVRRGKLTGFSIGGTAQEHSLDEVDDV